MRESRSGFTDELERGTRRARGLPNEETSLARALGRARGDAIGVHFAAGAARGSRTMDAGRRRGIAQLRCDDDLALAERPTPTTGDASVDHDGVRRQHAGPRLDEPVGPPLDRVMFELPGGFTSSRVLRCAG